ncbi:IS5 family transposase [Pseudoxanthomonas japonensis]|uniref:transposase n=1 Tax=Pseudoxanthomonas TaxID=83618 RepID=UPI000782B577|nr:MULTISPECIES: transposase [Pseudoxanthomonas]MDR7070347.1 IS5 family transposase [Pseudoxanthomonas japonensis]
MRQAKKIHPYRVGMKARIGVDEQSSPMLHAECTAANVADITRTHEPLRGMEDMTCGDSGHTGRRADGPPVIRRCPEMRRKRQMGEEPRMPV